MISDISKKGIRTYVHSYHDVNHIISGLQSIFYLLLLILLLLLLLIILYTIIPLIPPFSVSL